MVQFHCIDMNAWYSRVDKPTRPDYVLFDLDPPDGELRARRAEVAHLRARRAARGARACAATPKTSGADGIHVLVPIERRATFGRRTSSPSAVTRLLEARHPGVVTTEWLKAKRDGVFIDYHQNARGKTIASAYSVRPRAGAPVSTPLRWEELTADLDDRSLTMDGVLAGSSATATCSRRYSTAASGSGRAAARAGAPALVQLDGLQAVGARDAEARARCRPGARRGGCS